MTASQSYVVGNGINASRAIFANSGYYSLQPLSEICFSLQRITELIQKTKDVCQIKRHSIAIYCHQIM